MISWIWRLLQLMKFEKSWIITISFKWKLLMIQTVYKATKCRSSRSQMFFKICVLMNLATFRKKHLSWSLFLIKLQASRPATLLNRDSQHRCFSVDIAKFSRTAFLWNNSGGCFVKYLTRWVVNCQVSNNLSFFIRPIEIFPIFLPSFRSYRISLVSKTTKISAGPTDYTGKAVQKTLHKKWSFPLRISWVNVTKSAVSCRFGHIY